MRANASTPRPSGGESPTICSKCSIGVSVIAAHEPIDRAADMQPPASPARPYHARAPKRNRRAPSTVSRNGGGSAARRKRGRRVSPRTAATFMSLVARCTRPSRDRLRLAGIGHASPRRASRRGKMAVRADRAGAAKVIWTEGSASLHEPRPPRTLKPVSAIPASGMSARQAPGIA